ncbi:hypothetical protein [Streptomyces shenzhenensis]|uniref:hypothetical protein n=1 Tax=Streptomyces shenzhenensis TaxID=943815 RepID=UPI0015F01897|nr:hypothetical protein [Streptomyces shenzhenensis]
MQFRTKLAVAATAGLMASGLAFAGEAQAASWSPSALYSQTCSASYGSLRTFYFTNYQGSCDEFWATWHDTSGLTFGNGAAVNTGGVSSAENDNWRNANMYSAPWGQGNLHIQYAGTSSNNLNGLGLLGSLSWTPDWN